MNSSIFKMSRLCKKIAIIRCLAALTILLTTNLRANESQTDVEALLLQLESRARETSVIQFEFEKQVETGKTFLDHPQLTFGATHPLSCEQLDDMAEFQRQPSSTRTGKAIFDPMLGKFRVDVKEAGVSDRKTVVFDGNVHTKREDLHNSGVEQSEVEYSEVISEPAKMVIDASGVKYALWNVPTLTGTFNLPNDHFTVEQFCQLIRDNITSVTLEKDTESHLTLRVPYHEIGTAEYTFNIERGGVLVSARQADGPYRLHKQLINLEYIETDPGHWFPSEVVHTDWLNGFRISTQFTNVHILDKSESQTAFSITEEDATLIVDNIRGAIFMPSQGPAGDVDRIRTYASENQLSDTLQPSRSRTSIIVASSLILGIAVVCLFLRQRPKRRIDNLPIILLMLLVPPELVRAEDSPHGTSDPKQPLNGLSWNDGWRLEFGKDEYLRVSQCGFNVTVLALEAANRDYDPVLLSRSLVPTRNGISFSQIQTVIKAHGLIGHIRTDLSLSDIDKAVSSDRMAIVHVPRSHAHHGRFAHFLCVVKGRDGHTVVADPPFPLRKLSDVISEFPRSQHSYVAMFVTLPKNSDPNPSLRVDDSVVAFSPAHFVDGRYSTTLSLLNDGESPLVLLGVEKPCSCVNMAVEPQIVASGKTVELTLLINGEIWGGRETSKTLRFIGAVGELARVRIAGAAFTVPETGGAQKRIRKIISVPAAQASSNLTISSEFEVYGVSPEECSDFIIRTSIPELTARIHYSNGSVFVVASRTYNEDELANLPVVPDGPHFVEILRKDEAIPFLSYELLYTRDFVFSVSRSNAHDRDRTWQISIGEEPADWRLASALLLNSRVKIEVNKSSPESWILRAVDTSGALEDSDVQLRFESPGFIPCIVGTRLR